MECSPSDVPMTLRLELKSVVVFSIVFVRAFSWGGLLCWLLRLATLEHSVHRQALRSRVHLWGCCLRVSHRLGFTARPHGPVWAREQAWLQLSGQSSTSFPIWRAASPTPTYHRHDTGGLLLRARQLRRFFGSLAFPRQRLPGQVFEAT